MTDEHSTDDERLDERLRSGLRALVTEAPEPPPLREPSIARSSRRPLVLVATVLVLVVAVVGVMVTTRDDGDQQVMVGTTSTPSPAPAELVDTDWVLVGAHKGDVPLDGRIREARVSFTRCTGADCTAPYRIDGDDACNTFGGFVDIIGNELRLDGVAATLKGCGNDLLSPAVSRVFSSGSVRFERDGDRLRLTRGDVELVYQLTTEWFPTTQGLVVAQGQHDGDQWQISSWREGSMTQLSLTLRNGDFGTGVAGAVGTSVGSTDTSDSQQIVPLGSGQVVYGIAPARAARVTAEVEGHEPAVLDLHDLADSGGLQAFVGYTSSGTATIRIHDASGQVIQQQDNRPG